VSVASPGTVPRPPTPSGSGGSKSTATAPFSWSLLESPQVSCPTDRYCVVIGSIPRSGQGSYLIGTANDAKSAE
jgi:hypothetical protein